jgi:hypothetical protein
MAQAGMHGLVGIVLRKVAGRKKWLLLGILLGSLLPDMDNLGVAAATLAKLPTEGIHRTVTHGVFFMAAVVLAFYIVSRWRSDTAWLNLGLGLGFGMLLHSLLDVLLWFNGVALFWPLPLWINLWGQATPPAWFMKLMDPAEFLLFALYLWGLWNMARKAGTDAGFLGTLRFWLVLEAALFIIFSPLAFIMAKGFLTIYGAFYLFSIFMVFFVTISMRRTVEAVAG